MEDFDFIKAFTDVDILAVEAIAKIVGRVEAVIFKEMMSEGLTEGQAIRIIKVTIHSAISASLSSVAPSRADG